MVRTLGSLLTPDALRVLTSATTYARGVAYADEGRVQSLAITPTTLTAVVQGAQRYDVRWWLRGGTLAYSCTCAFAVEGACCKHAVAAGYQWNALHCGSIPPLLDSTAESPCD